MSNALAIAAVTATLRNLLLLGIQDLPNQNITTKPLDKARPADANKDQINIFLFQTTINATWRNMDMPRQRAAASAAPPLALNLHYLVTAYGNGDNDALSHRWLGRAMSIFHDHPLLGAQEIQNALLPEDSELQNQVERVRITPQLQSLEEMSKLWTALQTQYRVSAAYQVEVVLIESTRRSPVPLPVLSRGVADTGVTVVTGANLPIVDSVTAPHRQSSAVLGDELTITGQNLTNVAAVRFTLMNPAIPPVPPLLIASTTPLETQNGIKVVLPNDDAASTAWLTGFYSVAVAVNRDARIWSSNELHLSLAPRIDKIAPPNPIVRDVDDKVTLTLSCSPRIRLASTGEPPTLRFLQRVTLLMEPLNNPKAVSLSILPASPEGPPPPSMSTNTLRFSFSIPDDRTGEYLTHLRVDGIDLPLVDWQATPPAFRQKVTIV